MIHLVINGEIYFEEKLFKQGVFAKISPKTSCCNSKIKRGSKALTIISNSSRQAKPIENYFQLQRHSLKAVGQKSILRS